MRSSITRILIAFAMCLMLTETSSAIIVVEFVVYSTPLRKISGSVMGNFNPGLRVEVYDHPELWKDHSLSPNEVRKRQKLIASTSTDQHGKFNFRGVPKGAYEVSFSTGYGGWNDMLVFVTVDPAGSHDKLCVELSPEGQGEKGSVKACH